MISFMSLSTFCAIGSMSPEEKSLANSVGRTVESLYPSPEPYTEILHGSMLENAAFTSRTLFGLVWIANFVDQAGLREGDTLLRQSILKVMHGQHSKLVIG